MKYWEREGENVKEKKVDEIEIKRMGTDRTIATFPKEEGEIQVEGAKKEYTCKYCGAVFEKPVQIAQHVRHVHKAEQKAAKEVAEVVEAEAIIEPEEAGKIIDVVEEEKVSVSEPVIADVLLVNESRPRHLDTTAPIGIGVTSNVQPVVLQQSQPQLKLKLQPQPELLQVKPLLQPSFQQQPQQMINPLQLIRDKYEPLLMNYPRVTGVTLGTTPDQQPAIIVVVCKKSIEHEKLPKMVDGVPVILKEVLPEKAKANIFDRLLSSERWGLFVEGPIRKAAREFFKNRRGEKK